MQRIISIKNILHNNISKIFKAMQKAEVTRSEFKEWEKEILTAFHVANFTSNPTLFSNKDLHELPLLGNWTFNEYLGIQEQRYRTIMTDVQKTMGMVMEQNTMIMEQNRIQKEENRMLKEQFSKLFARLELSVNSNPLYVDTGVMATTTDDWNKKRKVSPCSTETVSTL